MTDQAQQEEADRAELIYQYALAHIGAATVADAMSEWESLPASKTPSIAGRWLSRLIQIVMARRSQSRKLALSYYRLIRALRTGTTIIDPLRDPEPEYVSLEMLREEFALLVDDAMPKKAPQEGADEDTAPAKEEPAETERRERTIDDYWAEIGEPVEAEGKFDPEPIDEQDAILTELIEGLDREMKAADAATEKYLTDVISAYEEDLAQKLAAIDPETPLKEAEKIAESLRVIAGSKEASSGELAALNGGRQTTFQIAGKDDRVIGYVRQVASDEPCAFCIMLASREVVYKTAASAGEVHDFHPNCYCTVVPVFNLNHIKNNPTFSQNREYSALWERVASKKGGLNALRRHLYATRVATSPKAATRAAA